MAETLGGHVARRRAELHMTQKDVATRMDKDKSFVGHIERNRAKRPSYALLVELATALEEPVDGLLEATGLRERYEAEARQAVISGEQERVIAFVRARLEGMNAEQSERAIRLLETIAVELPPSQ